MTDKEKFEEALATYEKALGNKNINSHQLAVLWIKLKAAIKTKSDKKTFNRVLRRNGLCE